MNERNELIKEKGLSFYNKVSKIKGSENKLKYFISTLEYTDRSPKEIQDYLNNFTDIGMELKDKHEALFFLFTYTNERNRQAKLKANKKWTDSNKVHANYLKNRSAARSFIRNKATQEDLLELKQLIEEKLTSKEK